MQDCSICKLNNGVEVPLSRPLVLSQLYDVMASSGRAPFPVKVEFTIVDSGGIYVASQAHSISGQSW